MPPLLVLGTEADYRRHFERTCCHAVVETHDGIRVYFKPQDFAHAFFESTLRNGVKDTTLSARRAERLDWIVATLRDPAAARYPGWDKKAGRHDPTRCVSVVFADFVVVVRLGKARTGVLKANFVTCYVADNSIAKIRQSPLWNRQDCLDAL